MIAGNGTKMKDRWNIVGCVLFCFVVFSIAYFRSIVKPDEKRSDPITAVDGAPKIRYNLNCIL